MTDPKVLTELKRDPKNAIFLVLYEASLIMSFETNEYKGKRKEAKNKEVCNMLFYFENKINN